MGTPVSGARFEREIMGRVMSLRLADGRLVQAQYQPDGTAAYVGTPFRRSGRWRPWDKGFCALYPWIGASPAVSRTYGGSPDAEGYRCYAVRETDGYYVLFDQGGVYVATLSPLS